jgi:hypothetical protein
VYIGRGVTEISALEYMLYHQNSLALVKLGSRRLASSQTLSPATSWFDCRHSQTCDKSRKYQPLPTMPCSRGNLPVTNVDCTEQVTAGKIVRSGRAAYASRNARKAGVCSPIEAGVSPTTFKTKVFCTVALLGVGARSLPPQHGIALEQLSLIDR